jgi:hypothetical protein
MDLMSESRIWPRYLLLTVAAVTLVGLAMMALVRAAAPDSGDVGLLIDGDVVLPIDSTAEHVEAFGGTLTVYRGAPSPGNVPDFDMEGVEQPLVQADPKWDWSTWPGDVPVVYVGDVNGRSVFVHTNGTIGWIDHIGAWLEGSSIGEHICMTVGDYDTPAGGIGFCGGNTFSGGRFVQNGPGELDQAWAHWVDLPEATSVVTAAIGGNVLLWQRPYGETVFFDLGKPPANDVLLTALDSTGGAIASQRIDVSWFHPSP